VEVEESTFTHLRTVSQNHSAAPEDHKTTETDSTRDPCTEETPWASEETDSVNSATQDSTKEFGSAESPPDASLVKKGSLLSNLITVLQDTSSETESTIDPSTDDTESTKEGSSAEDTPDASLVPPPPAAWVQSQSKAARTGWSVGSNSHPHSLALPRKFNKKLMTARMGSGAASVVGKTA